MAEVDVMTLERFERDNCWHCALDGCTRVAVLSSHDICPELVDRPGAEDPPRVAIISPSFSTVVIDPPWNERGGGRIKRGADRHYPLMKTPDIIRTVLQCPRWNQLAASAHLYLWVTNNFLQDGLRVIDALGFRYVTNFVWVKDRIGLGQYFRGRHELCLFSTRGSPTEPRSARRDLSSVSYTHLTLPTKRIV